MTSPPDASSLEIVIVTPAPRGSNAGNRITAARWARLLRGLGHLVVLEQEWSGRPCDLLIALHARKSAASIARFKEQRPDAPLILLLTGTDLLGDEEEVQLARRTLALPDRIAVLQPYALRELPPELRVRARVIRQSAKAPATLEGGISSPGSAGIELESGPFDVSVIGHLREVKDPLRAARAARLLPERSRLRVLHAGEALSEEMKRAAERETQENPRYRWLGKLPHARTVELLARSRLHVLTSFSEGGANVVSEAIACGVPVVSSRIDGSLGILGDAYPGYFEPGNERDLARLLRRCEEEPRFLSALQQWCERLRPLVDPAREQQALARLIGELEPLGRRSRAGADAGTGEERGPRLREVGGEIELPFTRLAASVKHGLASRPVKRLECCWFYDEEGSRLFEEICRLPEYYVTRAEDEILREHSGEIAGRLAAGTTLIELGSGSATKTRRLLDALLLRQPRLRYVMIDISPSALAESARELLAAYPTLEVVSICAEYADGIARLREETASPRLVLWLGSNVGNFHRDEAAEFLKHVRSELDRDDRLLVGIDLRKDKAVLERAYDDAAGVTARFNMNLLARVNRELGGDFDLKSFRHVAKYDEERGRVEMWLRSAKEQRVRVELLDLEAEFAAGEGLHTENSYKYSLGEIDALARAAGLAVEGQWLDRERRFADTLFAPVLPAPPAAPVSPVSPMSERGR